VVTIQLHIKWVPGLISRVKRPGRGVNHPLTPAAEVKERVELLYLGLHDLFEGELYLAA
jgi:hypothetical protein